MRIGVDVDGVLRDLERAIVAAFSRHLPETVRGAHSTDYTAFDQIDLPIREKRKLIFGSWVEEIFLEASPIVGSLPAFQELLAWAHENGHVVECVSANGGELAEYTRQWLEYHGYYFDDYHWTGAKGLVGVDFLIDDAPTNYDKWIDNNDESRFILMDQIYNVATPATYRASTLADALTILKELIPIS